MMKILIKKKKIPNITVCANKIPLLGIFRGNVTEKFEQQETDINE